MSRSRHGRIQKLLSLASQDEDSDKENDNNTLKSNLRMPSLAREYDEVENTYAELQNVDCQAISSSFLNFLQRPEDSLLDTHNTEIDFSNCDFYESTRMDISTVTPSETETDILTTLTKSLSKEEVQVQTEASSQSQCRSPNQNEEGSESAVEKPADTNKEEVRVQTKTSSQPRSRNQNEEGSESAAEKPGDTNKDNTSGASLQERQEVAASISRVLESRDQAPEAPDTSMDQTQAAASSQSTITDESINGEPPLKKKRIRDPKLRLKIAKEKHPMLPQCKDKCIRKCTTQMEESERRDIYEKYWNMDIQRRRDYISRQVERTKVAIKYSSTNKRNCTLIYKLMNRRVCKTMFLHTLGYTNDQAVQAVLKANFKQSRSQASVTVSAAPDLRGRHKPPHALPEDTVREIDSFIESFKPMVSHYRLEHAPNRRYLPTGVNIALIYKLLKLHLSTLEMKPCSWSVLYRRVQLKNISTAQPEQDKCPKCEAHATAHPTTTTEEEPHTCEGCNCDACAHFPQHRKNKTVSRAHLKDDVKKTKKDTTSALYTADMQKVISVPKLAVKDFYFSRKFVLFNETFAQVGKGLKPAVCMLWNESDSGRNAYDVASAYVLFIQKFCRDIHHLMIYAENSSAQNKNKTLYSALLRIVNDCSVALKSIKMEYLEPGHTFMSADSVHGAITKKINASGDLYDITDYENAIINSRKNTRINTHTYKDVVLFKNELKNQFPKKFNISNLKIVQFQRNKPVIFVKNDYEQENWKALDVIQKGLKEDIIKKVENKDMLKNLQRKQEPRGVSKKKKEDLENLLKYMPESRHVFYKNLLVKDVPDLDESQTEHFE